MATYDDTSRATIQLTRGHLVAVVQAELGGDTLQWLRADLLERIRATGARGVVLDLSGVDVIDSGEFAELRRTVSMAALMGAHCILAGLRAGVVSALVELDCDTRGLDTALGLDAALAELERTRDARAAGAAPAA